MIKQRCGYAAALIGSILLYMFYQEWLSVLLLALAIALPLLSLALSLPAMLSFRVVLCCVPSVTVGEASLAEVAADGDLPYRAWLGIKRPLTGESWHGGARVSLPTDHVGTLVVTAKRVRVYDRLGLIGIPVRYRAETAVTVRPRPTRMEIPASADSVLSTSWRPKAGGGYSEYHELRPYRPGDSLNHIHWKVTAKVGEPIIREPMQPDVRWSLMLTVRGTAEELDCLFGRLLYAGMHYIQHGVPFELRALTGGGLTRATVMHEADLQTAIDGLLACPPAENGAVEDFAAVGFRVLVIGGDADEA